jgi:hypothetical protein
MRMIHNEEDMQLSLASRLEVRAKGAYIVDRESEVADGKRPDIRLTTMGGEQRGVIEIKVADKRWSQADLEKALRDQVDGLYLRHERCRAGVLLLTYDGTRSSWGRMESEKKLGFTELVVALSEAARKIEAEKEFSIRLGVFGLDLTDPPIPESGRASKRRPEANA